MRLGFGFSVGLGRLGRVGIGRSGRPWFAAGASQDGAYVSLFESADGGGGQGRAHLEHAPRRRRPSAVQAIRVQAGPDGARTLAVRHADGSVYRATLTAKGVARLRAELES